MPGEDHMGLPMEQLEHYHELRARGESHNMALMLATGSPPSANKQDERWKISREGRRMGLGVTGKYQGGLARFPNDPRAVVQSRGEAHERAAALGMRITDQPENADSGRQDTLKRARAGDCAAQKKIIEEV